MNILLIVRRKIHFKNTDTMCDDNYDAESYDNNYYVKSNDSNSHTYDGNKVNIPKEDDDVKYNENYEKNIIVSS